MRVIDEASGEREFDLALEFIDRYQGAHGDLVRGILVPREIETCTVPLMRKAAKVAQERDLPAAIHAAYNIDEVFDILREKDVHIDKQTWNRRYRGFMEKIKTGSLFDVAEVYRDLYRLKSSKVLSFGERKMLDNAKQLIVKELAVARKWTEEKVEAELEKACA